MLSTMKKNGDEPSMISASEQLHHNMEHISQELNRMLACVEDEYPSGESTYSSSDRITSDTASKSLGLEGAALVHKYMPAFSVLEQTPLINFRVSESVCKQQGAIRKRWLRKYSSKQNSKYLYENIVLDYEALGISGEVIKMDAVHQLLLALNDCYNAILEPMPTEPGREESVFGAAFYTTKRIFLSPSQNISAHIQTVVQRINSFLQEMKGILSMDSAGTGGLWDEVYHRYWWHLYRTSRVLYTFLGLRLEHKNDKFLDSTNEGIANHLVVLLRSINHQIRELRLHCIAITWFVSVRARGVDGLNSHIGKYYPNKRPEKASGKSSLISQNL